MLSDRASAFHHATSPETSGGLSGAIPDALGEELADDEGELLGLGDALGDDDGLGELLPLFDGELLDDALTLDDGEAEALPDGLALGEPDAELDGDELGEADGLGLALDDDDGEPDGDAEGERDGLAEMLALKLALGLMLALGEELGIGESSTQTSSKKHGGDHFWAWSDQDRASRPLKYTTLKLSGCEPTMVSSTVQSRIYRLTGAAKE